MSGRLRVTKLEYMVTDSFEITDNYKSYSELNRREYYVDDGLRMVMPKKEFQKEIVYLQYLQSFCKMLNDNPNGRPAYLADCGFIPIGVEPTVLCGQINSEIILPALRKYKVDYFFVQPMSPKFSTYRPQGVMAREQDVWVNKIDCAKLLGKQPHQVRVFDLLEVIFQ